MNKVDGGTGHRVPRNVELIGRARDRGHGQVRDRRHALRLGERGIEHPKGKQHERPGEGARKPGPEAAE